jgi:CubicO group peptidase (beta-lactamase class C family)
MDLKDKAVASVERTLDRIAGDGPGCAIGVVRDGEVLLARGRGLASLEHGAPITPASRFYMASVSKQVTALAVLLAAEAGALDIADPIRKNIPELPAHMGGVTLEHLLAHTSGVRDYLSLGFLGGVSSEHVFTEADVLDSLRRQRGLNFAPGTEVAYSNSGYVLLAMAVHRATGKRLDDFARETIFDPLGMTGARFQHDHAAVVPDKAHGYEKRGEGWFTADSMLDTVGDGGLYASLEDMLAWAKNLLAPHVGAAALARMATPVVLPSGGLTGYGFGLELGEHRGLAFVQHAGGLAGYRTHLVAYPGERLAIVFLSNDDAAIPSLAAFHVAESCLGERMTPAPAGVDLPVESVRACAGLYRGTNNDNVLSLVEQDGRLALQGAPLRVLGPGRFAFQRSIAGSTLTFDDDERGFVVHHTGGPVDRFARCDPPAAIDTAAFTGVFASPELAASWRVSQTETGLALGVGRQPPAALQPVAPDCFQANGVTLTFARGAAGAVTGFRGDGARVRGLVFERTG